MSSINKSEDNVRHANFLGPVGKTAGARMTEPLKDRDYVLSLEKGLAVIEAFGQLRGPATLTQIAEATGHTKAAVRRSLATLCQLGYASQQGRLFSLAARTLRLGSAYVVSDALARLAQPILETTAERTRESASIAVLDAQDVVFVARATHRRSLSVGLSAGARLPAYASATGRVLLAAQPRDWVLFILNRMSRPALTARTITSVDRLMQEIERVHSQGYALCDQELELGLRSIAVPIQDRSGRTVAAMSLSIATSRMDMAHILEQLLPELVLARQKFPALL